MKNWKWTAQDESVNFAGTVSGADAASEEDAEAIVERHNKQCAALEAERDELKRRLDAVLNKLDNPYWVGLPYEPTIGAVRQIAAQCHDIAEGRTP